LILHPIPPASTISVNQFHCYEGLSLTDPTIISKMRFFAVFALIGLAAALPSGSTNAKEAEALLKRYD
jgi:hypothetical protein